MLSLLRWGRMGCFWAGSWSAHKGLRYECRRPLLLQGGLGLWGQAHSRLGAVGLGVWPPLLEWDWRSACGVWVPTVPEVLSVSIKPLVHGSKGMVGGGRVGGTLLGLQVRLGTLLCWGQG